MYKKYKKSYKKRSFKKGKKPSIRKAVRRVRNSSFKKRVLSVIHKEAETKQAFLGSGYIDFNSAIATSSEAYRIIPNVNYGTGDNARIGDHIRVQKLKLDMILQFKPLVSTAVQNNPGTNRIACRIMIVTPKSYPNWNVLQVAATNWTQMLLKKGGTTTGFDGFVEDLYAPINTDAITCHYQKLLYFNQPWVLHQGSTTDVAMSQAGVTRHLKKVFKFKNKLFKYDAGIDSGLTPVNAGYFIILGYAYTDGSTGPDILTSRMRLQYESNMYYEDM